MIDFKTNKNNHILTLDIIGDAVIENASIIKNKILEYINEKSLIINIDKINKTDISFIQIIFSLINDFENNESKKLSFSYKNQDNILVSYINKYGFSHYSLIEKYFNYKGGKIHEK